MSEKEKRERRRGADKERQGEQETVNQRENETMAVGQRGGRQTD